MSPRLQSKTLCKEKTVEADTYYSLSNSKRIILPNSKKGNAFRIRRERVKKSGDNAEDWTERRKSDPQDKEKHLGNEL
ncbi:hypothetical protein OUZ56_004618 [Daphnia magna]|uniref:Uncharacterized protein n=1 Tax=Daphnia magna TaxID=35525 RepID=A0ABQ9YQE3_9CRUS|nr:hypothetical protein OUZ56_004618 [Daphnia magna]